MAGEPQSHIADDLARIHKVVTRSLVVARARGVDFARAGFPDATARAGFLDYARCALAVLRSHHDLEEKVAFPRLATVADVPFERLEREHHHLVDLLDAAQIALESVALDALVTALGQIEALWRAHIAVEEQHLTAAAIDRALGPADQLELGRAVGEFAAQNSKPEELVLPFILFNLEGADRAAMAARLPAIITQQLIPGPWKPKWEPMSALLIAPTTLS